MGILGIGAEPAVVKVTLLDDAPASAADYEEQRPPSAYEADEAEADEEPEPADRDEAPDLASVTSDVLESLIELMDVDVEYTLDQEYNEEVGGPVFEIEGDDAGLLIGRRGETLRSFQFIVRYIVSRRMDSRVHLLVDVEGYYERRRQSLSNMARRVARRVSDTGRPISLEPMSPNERRIIHIALTDHPRVVTESDGEGDARKVVIHLK